MIKHLFFKKYFALLPFLIFILAQFTCAILLAQTIPVKTDKPIDLHINKGIPSDTITQHLDSLSNKTNHHQEQIAKKVDSLPIMHLKRLSSQPLQNPSTSGLYDGKTSFQEYVPAIDPAMIPKKVPLEPLHKVSSLSKKTDQPKHLINQQKHRISNIKKHNDKFNQAKKTVSELHQDSTSAKEILTDTLQHMVPAQLEERATQQAAKYLSEELPSPPMVADPQEDMVREKLTAEAQALFAADQEKLSQAQKHLSTLKKKYSRLQQADSIYVKTNSLQGVPLRERLVYGLNFQMDHMINSSLTASPFIGYQFNKVWRAGMGMQFRTAWQTNPWQLDSSVDGIHVYGQRLLHRHFLFHAEVASQKPLQLSEVKDQPGQEYKLNLGVGKLISLTDKLGMQVLILLDVMPNSVDSFEQRWQLRVGLCRSSE